MPVGSTIASTLSVRGCSQGLLSSTCAIQCSSQSAVSHACGVHDCMHTQRAWLQPGAALQHLDQHDQLASALMLGADVLGVSVQAEPTADQTRESSCGLSVIEQPELLKASPWQGCAARRCAHLIRGAQALPVLLVGSLHRPGLEVAHQLRGAAEGGLPLHEKAGVNSFWEPWLQRRLVASCC